FIEDFLSNVLPPIYRFGTGDATDISGHRSGQLDVVVEYPISPSLPGVGRNANTRLYLAESIAAVIEVKSNIASQWGQAIATANQLAPLRKKIGSSMKMGGLAVTDKIPLFVAGYTGWTKVSTAEQNLGKNPDIAGVLVIDSGVFVSSNQYAGIKATGPWGLWGLISVLHLITNSLQAASTNPLQYS
ncbi:MAG: hypothetical protein O6924_11235, partial [Alphaproteobacteria bacterium]|nr:hypothetical protein [Alphaproteobacteria bacterium]